MKTKSPHRPSHAMRAAVGIVVLLTLGIASNLDLGMKFVGAHTSESIPNNEPFRNPNGKSATFSTQGSVNLMGEYFQAQGTNGRSCVSCHIPDEAWSINPGTLQHLFDETNGTHPVFNPLDGNNQAVAEAAMTVEQKLAAYSMMLTRGVFRRGGIPRANSEWELIAVEDPHGFANLNRFGPLASGDANNQLLGGECDRQLGRR